MKIEGFRNSRVRSGIKPTSEAGEKTLESLGKEMEHPGNQAEIQNKVPPWMHYEIWRNQAENDSWAAEERRDTEKARMSESLEEIQPKRDDIQCK